MLAALPRALFLAFTGTPLIAVEERTREVFGDYVSIYVPTTPNPTSGFFLILPKSEVIEVEMSVDTALKYIVSMGVVAPGAVVRPAEAARLPQSEI